MTKRKPK